MFFNSRFIWMAGKQMHDNSAERPGFDIEEKEDLMAGLDAEIVSELTESPETVEKLVRFTPIIDARIGRNNEILQLTTMLKNEVDEEGEVVRLNPDQGNYYEIQTINEDGAFVLYEKTKKGEKEGEKEGELFAKEEDGEIVLSQKLQDGREEVIGYMEDLPMSDKIKIKEWIEKNRPAENSE